MTCAIASWLESRLLSLSSSSLMRPALRFAYFFALSLMRLITAMPSVVKRSILRVGAS